MIFLFEEFLDLVSKGDIGQKESAVLLVVVIFGLIWVSRVKIYRTLEVRFKSQSPLLNKIR